MRAPSRSRARIRPATAVVELAVCLPLLVGLLLGIWEIGRMIQVKQILANATREGARSAATGTKTIADVDAVVRNYLTAAGITTTGYTVKVYNLRLHPNPTPSDPSDDPSQASQLDQLRVVVTLPFNNVKWVAMNHMTSVTTLASQSDWFCTRDKSLVVDTTMPSG